MKKVISSRARRRLVALGFAGIAALGSFGFTAANTVPGTSAGDGAGVISGYSVTNVAYALDAADPSLLGSVGFSLDGAASVVKARVGSGSSFVDCTNTSGNDWSCDLSSAAVSVASADELRVVAHD